MRSFDITDPLPGVGTTVLEASAGTGKTYTVAALATRYVAEGLELDSLLVITFSRAATQELRDRVREQLVRAAAGLADPDSARAAGGLIGALASDADGAELDDDQIAVRRSRLLAAVAGYDAATIATTHEFCHAVLRSLGVAGDSDAREELREEVGRLAEDVVADRYLARWAGELDPPVRFRDARRVATAAWENPHAALRPVPEPAPGPGTPEPGTPGPGAPERPAAGTTDDAPDHARELVEFATGVRAEVEARKQRAGVITFDDMLSRLARALEPLPGRPLRPAAERMRARWQVVLVDEFQDTDPVQWEVLREAFAGHAALVLIGDPKQAIYAFRGGDTPTYLAAVDGADTRTLDTNHRSDAAVVDALRALLAGARLGDDRIEVHPVTAARSGSSLVGGSQAGTAHHVRSGVRLRRLRRQDFSLTKGNCVPAASWKAHTAADLAADIARQLDSGASVRVTGPDGVTRTEPLGAGHIAILLPSVKREGPAFQAALTERGIPWVVNTAESVMTGAGAADWLRLLEAMELPSHTGRVRAAALTPLLGETPATLDAGGQDLTDSLAERIRSWTDLFRSRGIAGVQAAAQAGGLAARALAYEGGERILTDLNHVGELLHRAGAADRLGLAGLIRWLRDAIEEGNRSDTRRRRLDIDSLAVQFVTIHGAKGLEYPIVYAPRLFDRSPMDWRTEHIYHADGQRCLDLANSPDAAAQARREQAEEDLRLAYVAMTRARAQLVLWWAPTYNGHHGALTRLLFGRGPGEPQVPIEARFPDNDEESDASLAVWASAGAFTLEDSVVAASAHREPPVPPVVAARRFDRALDLHWRRTSYSGLIRAEEQAVAATLSEPEEAGISDEDGPDPLPGIAAPVARPGTDLPSVDEQGPHLPSPMEGIVAGATFGSLVHAVIEHVDPDAPDLAAEVRRHVEEQRRWWSVPTPTEDLVAALLPFQLTGLGPLAGDRTLQQIPLRDRLRELDFEIPLADGDRLPAGAAAAAGAAGPRGLPLSAIAGALRRHLAEDDPIRDYASRLENPSLGEQVLRGYLSGSIDAVLRVEVEGVQRFLVVDYKTNTLGEPGTPLTTADYTPDKVAAAMVHSHYPLQALLYSVVLHRFLRWRLPGYDPAVHLGGVLYLYVRGMAGPATPVIEGVPCGVFSWQPPSALIEELSAILDGRAADEGVGR